MPDDLLPDVPGDLFLRPPPPEGWRERLERLADATGSTPSRIAAGAVALLVLAGGALWLLRPPADPPEVSLPFASTTVAAEATTSTPPPDRAVVHVTGAVLAPGVYELLPGARVVDAVEAAGGLSGAADPTRLNLAAPVPDGARVYVLARGEVAEPPASGTSGGPGAAGTPGPVDLNTADQAALEELPGIGPATAAAIIEHRGKVGRFTSVEQLLDVPGIGDAKLEAVRDLVTV